MGNSDSKSKFRESVYKLYNETVSAKQLEFWDKLWRIQTVAEEIFTLIQPDDVRMLRRQQPQNLATMLKQAVAQLIQIVDTPVPKYYQQAINCVRVLTRLVPFILEDACAWLVQPFGSYVRAANQFCVSKQPTSSSRSSSGRSTPPRRASRPPTKTKTTTTGRPSLHASRWPCR